MDFLLPPSNSVALAEERCKHSLLTYFLSMKYNVPIPTFYSREEMCPWSLLISVPKDRAFAKG